MREHRVIERMIGVMRRELATMEQRGAADPAFIDVATDFIRSYADRCHHGKEEDILFRRLAAKDLDPALSAAMEDLIQDHVRARAMTRRLVDANRRYAAGDRDALGEIVSVTGELAAFYPVHIEKEDRHFFKPCLEYFSEQEKEAMLADFDEFDRALIHERYRGIVEELERGDA
jgi:hemerythrin-like domain-containing protein